MTPVQPQMPGRPSSPRSIVHHNAGDHIKIRMWHMAEPWLAWLLLPPLALVLRMKFAGTWGVLAVAVPGAGLAFLTHRLSHRITLVGRWIGSVTVAACASWMTAVVAGGWSWAALESWLYGGLAGCTGWNIWLVAGLPHDLSRAFTAAAEVSGAAGSRLGNLRRKKNVTTGTIQLPRGALRTADVAVRLENLEGALAYPPGSWSLSNNSSDAGLADVSITDPMLLDRAPLPWPGPSAPGQGVAVPFREGVWADGEVMSYELLPVHHEQAVGATGTGKSMSWAWNHIGEGITRHDYACIAADITKGDQFLGPLRPALHMLVTEPDAIPGFMSAVDRVIRVRCDFLAKNRLTEWKPGCGLTFLDVWLEETPDILALLDRRGLQQYVKAVRASRTAGIAHRHSYQRTDHTQLPTIARAQMGHLCFGVFNKKDAEFGLSELQRERGCRPQLWEAKFPGKAYRDTLTIPDSRKTVPMRFFWWGDDASRLAAYASEWPSSRRPLDDVTGEALEAVPGRPVSSGFPVSRSQLARSQLARSQPARSEPARSQVARSRPARSRPASPAQPAGVPRRRMPLEEARKQVIAQLEDWQDRGKDEFTPRELMRALGEGIICSGSSCPDVYCTGRSRGWLYLYVRALTAEGRLTEMGGNPTRWAIGDLAGAG